METATSPGARFNCAPIHATSGPAAVSGTPAGSPLRWPTEGPRLILEPGRRGAPRPPRGGHRRRFPPEGSAD
eukprot:11621849-Alexandrium_andersonii.AAC.1